MSESDISIRHGVQWVGVAQISKSILYLISIIILARILPPSDYGLMAMGTVFLGFVAIFKDMGTGAAIIHAEEVSEEFKNTVFWFNVAIGSSLSVGIISISSLAAMILVEPRLEALLTFLSPVFFVGSLSISHQALLERQSKFKTIAIVEILSGFLALIGALVVALNGGGVYALATQHLVGVVLTTIAYWTVSRWVPKFEMAISALGQALKYGGNIFIFNVVNYFHRNADSFLIGRFIGAADLGIYNVAYRILLFPLSNITFVIARASFPAYSRGKADITKVGSHYLNTLGVIAFITAPMMAFIWALREPFIIVILGTKWLVSADVIAWLAPVGFFQSLVSTSGSVLSAIGRPDILRNLGFVGVPFLVLSIAVGIPWGIEGVATGYCIANAIWVYPVMRTVLRQLERPFLAFLKAVLKPSVFAVVIALILMESDEFLSSQNIGALYRILLLGASGAGFYWLAFAVFAKQDLARSLDFVKRKKRKAP